MRAVEERYLALLERAGDVEDIIKVQERLDYVQQEIERLIGRKRYLDNQTEMATLTVFVSEETTIKFPESKWQPLVVVKNAVRALIQILQGFVDNVIIFVFVILGLIPYFIILFLL